jgi:hypothetical protein
MIYPADWHWLLASGCGLVIDKFTVSAVFALINRSSCTVSEKVWVEKLDPSVDLGVS